MLFLVPSILMRFRARPAVSVVSAAPQELSTVYFPAGITQIRPRDKSILAPEANESSGLRTGQSATADPGPVM